MRACPSARAAGSRRRSTDRRIRDGRPRASPRSATCPFASAAARPSPSSANRDPANRSPRCRSCGSSSTAAAASSTAASQFARPGGDERRPRARPTPATMREIRGAEIAMIFQEPMTSLNPVFPVGEQIAESIRLHQRKDAARRARRGAANARAGAHSRSAVGARPLSAPAVRRHAPARDDRDGAVVPPRAADRRRADHRARRDDPGADPDADPPAAGRDAAWR